MAANPKSEVLDSTENSSYPQYHVYHAEAHVLSGDLKHPIKQPIEREGHVILDKTRREGHLTRSTDGNSLEGLITYKAGSTRASGNKVEKRDAWGKTHSGWVTLSTSVIEGLNVFEVVTADRVVAQVSTEHPEKNGKDLGHVPKVTFLGSRFENLRIGGFPVEVELDLGICGDRPANDKPYVSDDSFLDRVQHQIERIVKTKGLPASLEKRYDAEFGHIDDLRKRARGKANGQPNGYPKLQCSLVKSIGPIPIPGVEIFGNLILIPDFGTVSLGDLEIGIEKCPADFADKKKSPSSEKQNDSNYFTLNMVNMHLGCIGGGTVTAASAKTNGQTKP
jgi:hypothetical protein